MQQENGGRIFRPSFSVEDGESINLNCAVEDLLLHSFVLCLGICGERGGEHQYQDSDVREDPICRSRNVHASPDLLCNFKDHFKFDRHPQRQAGNANHQPHRHLVGAKQIAK